MRKEQLSDALLIHGITETERDKREKRCVVMGMARQEKKINGRCCV